MNLHLCRTSYRIILHNAWEPQTPDRSNYSFCVMCKPVIITGRFVLNNSGQHYSNFTSCS